jgi:hypothetical protein
MVSNRIAFVALGLACVTAAGVGGYLGTRHNMTEVPAAAAESGPAEQAASTPAVAATSPQPAPLPDLAPTQPAHATSAAGAAAATKPSQAAPATTTGKKAPARAPISSEVAAVQHTDASQVPSDHGAMPAPMPPPPVAEAPVPQHPDDRPADVAHAPEPPAPSYDELVVAADSVIGLQTETSLSSESAHVEDRVEARVIRDVRVGGRVAIPAGTRALGSVVVVERGGKLRDRARLGIRFNTLALPDGTRLPITTETIYRYGDAPGNGSAAKIGGGAVAGAILGAIIGGGKGAAIGATTGAAGGSAAVMAGQRSEATLAAGMEVTARIISPISVTVER